MWPLVFSLSFVVSSSLAYYVELDVNQEKCFHEIVNATQKIAFNYEVAEGGFLDIDVQIFSPDGTVLYNEPKKSSGRPRFVATQAGKYTCCFSNKMSSLTPKVVLFDIETTEDHLTAKAEDDEAQRKLIQMLNDLSQAIEAVKNEMGYVSLRTNIHWNINQDTNFRVVLWAAFEALLIIAMSIGQVFYLKRFFEVRRLV